MRANRQVHSKDTALYQNHHYFHVVLYMHSPLIPCQFKRVRILALATRALVLIMYFIGLVRAKWLISNLIN